MSTHTRREIRQAAIQFLYCYQLEGGAPIEKITDAFWELLLEDDFIKLTKASVKSVLHLNHGRQKRYQKLGEMAPELLRLIDADPDAKKLGTALNAILRSESKWQSLIDRLQLLFKPQEAEVADDLVETLKEIYLLNHTLHEQRLRWKEMLEDNPQFKKHAESVNASINALDRVSERIFMVENPLNFPSHNDIKHLIETSNKMTNFKNAVMQNVQLVAKNKEAIDEKINSVVENYAPERINPIDRAILRLGTAEILYDDEIPAPVAISEALHLANQFSSEDSSKFINGVLDKIAKS